MKNIQVIDGALNSGYWIYQISNKAFGAIFPEPGQNIEFIDDLICRLGEDRVAQFLTPAWKRRIPKEDVLGIHGTLFFECEYKKPYYPNKRESDLDDPKVQGTVHQLNP